MSKLFPCYNMRSHDSSTLMSIQYEHNWHQIQNEKENLLTSSSSTKKKKHRIKKLCWIWYSSNSFFHDKTINLIMRTLVSLPSAIICNGFWTVFFSTFSFLFLLFRLKVLYNNHQSFDEEKKHKNKNLDTFLTCDLLLREYMLCIASINAPFMCQYVTWNKIYTYTIESFESTL